MRILLAASAVWLVLAIFPLARDVTLIKVVGFQALIFLAALLAWRNGRKRNEPAREGLRLHAPLALAAALFALFLLAAAPFATNPGHAFMELARLLPGIVAFFLAMYAFRSPADVIPLVTATAAALTLASLYGILQWLGWDPFPWGAVTSQDFALLRRAPATYGNPNLAAHAIILGIPLVVLLISMGRWWALAFLPALLFHLALNGTRGALLGLAFAILMTGVAWGLSRRAQALPRNAALAAGVVVPIIIAVMTGAAVLGLTQLRTGSPVPSDSTLTLRFHAMHGAAEMIRDRPVIGHGPGHFVIDNAPYWTTHEQTRYAEIGRRNARVHNEPLEIAVQGGLIAGASYLALMALAIVQGLAMAIRASDPAQRRIGLAFAAVFAAFAVDGLFGFNLHAPVSGGLFWLLLGAFAGLHAQPWADARGLRFAPRVWPAMAGASAVALVLGGMAFASSVYALRGDGALTHGEPEAAHRQYEVARQLHPWDWRIQQSLGGLMLDQSYFGSAAGHFEEALALHPNDPASMVGLGRAQAYQAAALESEGMDGYREAERVGLDAALRAQALSPSLAEAALVRALIAANQVAREQQGQGFEAAAQEASEAAEALLALEPVAMHQAWQLAANARAANGDLPGTFEAFAMALTHEPSAERTWRAMDAFAHSTGRYGPYLDSVRWREERLRLEHAEAATERATMAIRRAEAVASGYRAPAQVSAAFQDAASIEPLLPGLWPAFYAFSRHAERMPPFRVAVLAAGEALAEVTTPETLSIRIAALAAQGGEAIAAAAENCYQAIAFNLQQREAPEVREEFGWVWEFVLGETTRLPESDETSALVLLRMGMAASLLGDDARAVEVFASAAPDLPREPRVECLRQLAAAAMRLGQGERALDALAQAVTLAPENLGARLEQARALAAAGSREAARHAYTRILADFQFDPENRARLEAEMAQVAGV